MNLTEDALAGFDDAALDRLALKADASQTGQLLSPPRPSGAQAYAPAALGPLAWVDMFGWDEGPPPERQWAVKDRIPLRQAGLFSGEGGTGKSIIELMKNVAHVTGKDWLGSMPERGPAFYIGAEDEVDELRRRLDSIAKHYGTNFKELIEGGLYIKCLLGEDATLCAANGKSGRVEVTGLYRQLYEAAGDIKPKNISIDTLSRAFAGNEIDRVQVYAFAMHMQALAKVSDGSVTVLSHPSLAGMSSGSGISGSTAWHGAFRFRMYLRGFKADRDEQPETDLRELEFKKNQYGPLGETVCVKWEKGIFVPQGPGTSLEALAREQTIDDLFLKIATKVIQQGRDLSPLPTSHGYAPTIIAEQAEAKEAGLRKRDLKLSLERLLDAKRLRIESDGPPSKQRKRLLVGLQED